MNVLSVQKQRRKDYVDGYAAGRKDGCRQCVEFMIYSMIQYLGDKRGWKPERIMEAVAWIAKHAAMIDEELTTYTEVQEAVKEEYGIILKDGSFCLMDKSA